MRTSTEQHPRVSRLGVIALVAIYLAAVVVANLTVAYFGPAVVILNAFVLIALDLTTRDRLHEAWHGDPWKLGALILAGGALSAALNAAALPVAVASCAAFAAAGAVDSLVYARLAERGWYWKTNGSNAASAAVDSLVFLGVMAGFGLLPWALVPVLAAGQWLAKFVGGALWSWVLARRAQA